MSKPPQYTRFARILHWLIAGLIVSQFILGKLAERAEDNDELVQQLGLLANHKSLGMTIFMLAILRIVWRVWHTPPAMPAVLPRWQGKMSAIVHWLLYALIFLLPISGWLMSSATAYSVSWFNLFVFPDLVLPSESLAHNLQDIHQGLGNTLAVIAGVHVIAALKHHYIDSDTILNRMASVGGWALFIASSVIAIGLLGQISLTPNTNLANINQSGQTQELIADKTRADKTRVTTPSKMWDVDYAASHISFTGDQAGAPFTGRWQHWIAEMWFDSDDLEHSFFDVTIQVDSVFSDDATRDETILSADFFDVANYPEVRYVADQFVETSAGNFQANGKLVMKELSHAATLRFIIQQKDGQTILIGKAMLDRFAWNIGMGDWADTTWVGQQVEVDVRLVTK